MLATAAGKSTAQWWAVVYWWSVSDMAVLPSLLVSFEQARATGGFVYQSVPDATHRMAYTHPSFDRGTIGGPIDLTIDRDRPIKDL